VRNLPYEGDPAPLGSALSPWSATTGSQMRSCDKRIVRMTEKLRETNRDRECLCDLEVCGMPTPPASRRGSGERDRKMHLSGDDGEVDGDGGVEARW
jgi:hypothetical protein